MPPQTAEPDSGVYLATNSPAMIWHRVSACSEPHRARNGVDIASAGQKPRRGPALLIRMVTGSLDAERCGGFSGAFRAIAAGLVRGAAQPFRKPPAGCGLEP